MAKKNQQTTQTQEPVHEGNSAPAPAPKKGNRTICPVTRGQFAKEAKPILVMLDGMGRKTEMVATVKHFESGSVGWYAGGKVIVMIDGTPVECQLGVNLTVIGSKELPA